QAQLARGNARTHGNHTRGGCGGLGQYRSDGCSIARTRGWQLTESFHRIGELVVPIRVEGVRKVAHYGTGREHVEVGKIEIAIARVVLVAEVAPAADCQRAVDDEELV